MIKTHTHTCTQQLSQFEKKSKQREKGEVYTAVVQFERHTTINPNKYTLLACLQCNSIQLKITLNIRQNRLLWASTLFFSLSVCVFFFHLRVRLFLKNSSELRSEQYNCKMPGFSHLLFCSNEKNRSYLSQAQSVDRFWASILMSKIDVSSLFVEFWWDDLMKMFLIWKK